MGLEGAVRLAYRKELEAEPDAEKKKAFFDRKLAELYDRGKAIAAARSMEIDDVIDPATSRAWIVQSLEMAPPAAARQGKKRRNVDSW